MKPTHKTILEALAHQRGALSLDRLRLATGLRQDKLTERLRLLHRTPVEPVVTHTVTVFT